MSSVPAAADIRPVTGDGDGGADPHDAMFAAYLADTEVRIPLALAVEWTKQARADGYQVGWSAGFLEAVADEKRAQTGIVRALRDTAPTTPDTWMVRCGNHRRGLSGRCGPTGWCERRTRQTYGEPHTDDFAGVEVSPAPTSRGVRVA